MSEKLTDIRIKNLAAESKQFELSDSQVLGLRIRVSFGGTKAFYFMYRIGEKKRRIKLGTYPEISVKEAREKARYASKKVAEGKDPQAEKQAQRLNYDQELFGGIVELHISMHVDANTKPRSASETKRILRKKFVPIWRRLHISQIDKKMVLEALDEILERDGPSAANHAFSAIRKFFNWCIERDYLRHSPCQGLKKPAKNQERERTLDDHELASVWKATSDIGYPFGHYVKLLILTGQRRSEVAGLRWSELDLDQSFWEQSTNKSDRLHLVPLSRQAKKVILSIPKVHKELLFPARGGSNPISGFSKWKKRFDQICGVSDWTLQDLRRTLATKMDKLKVPLVVSELTLNHSSKSLSGVARVYHRHDYWEEKCEAMQNFADKLDLIVSAAQSKAGLGTATSEQQPMLI
jgi:integrase